MELRDLIVTPLVLFLVYGLAYGLRPLVTDRNTRRYFIPALTVKIIGALAVGFIYQFYYGGGDTFAFHTHGSRVVWEAFMDNPMTGLKLLFADGQYIEGTYNYASRIWYFRDEQTYWVIRVSTLLDILTFSSYSATAILFAVLCFSGMWVLFKTFNDLYKELHFYLALAILFVPSVFFWGSGLFKDTITLGCLGWMTYSFYQLVIKGRFNPILIVLMVCSALLTYFIKKYILLSFLPALVIWVSISHFNRIRILALRALIAPIAFGLCLALGYLTADAVGKDDPRYAINNLAKTAQVTAYDIRYGWGARFGEGSGYTLGELDGTFTSMVKLAPAAVNVSLFRPYLWEVNNPLMLLSAMEALVSLLLTLWVIYKISLKSFLSGMFNADVLFCWAFALVFAFAVGISTFNFGTLARYKIPLLPYYFTGLILIYHYGKSKRLKKLAALASTE